MKLTVFQKFLWVLAGVATAAFAYLMLWSDYRSARTEDGPVPFKARFELTDHSGVIRTQNDFAGKWMLVFFGFTNCPDVCPTTLSEVAAVKEEPGEQSSQIQPIFISMNPERDTPAVPAEYVPFFDAGIIGLSGRPEQIAQTSKTFPISYERVEQVTAPDGYTMGHTSHLFLFNEDAGFVLSWSYGTPAEEILADLKQRI